ncbi:permease [Vibrio vulnificus YJ016]|uniref:Permease n=1 Tax=Vibrio vulnificus (strain YJ016) TaxID=196600 RepID=Q7MF31_VIBVY|nr:MFS transporter [Vibrio vulnificus]PWY35466.1 MFS transporter [Vibrio vulnificus]RZP66867.1 MFS transporter [Vibrio vulnificus]RZR11805.1 MFS transporter [Vibrio vulnificus]BAC96515.1 permease [Vibrio vulnificus YJ016]HAS6170781.1 MFS transporter [Vibrio vulnificus]
MDTKKENNTRWLLIALCLAQFTLSADVANLSISTAALVSVFQTDISSIQFLGSVQPLVGAAIMLSASVLGLIIGWRRLLILGTSVGLISTIGFITIDSITLLSLLVRPLAGIASALILPAAIALVVAHFPGKNRAVGFGLMAASTGFAAAIIPLMSGWLHDNTQWYWPFIIIALCYLFSLLAAIFWIRPIHTNCPKKFDLLGALLGAISIVTIFFGLIKMPYWGAVTVLKGADIPVWLRFVFPISPALILLGAGLILFALFVGQQRLFEKQHGFALLPFSWFKNRASRIGFVVLALMYVALGGCSFVIVTYLQVALSLSSAHSGGIILLFSLSMIGLSVTTPILFKHQSPKKLCQVAFLGLLLAGAVLMVSSKSQHILAPFYLGMILFGAAMGVLASQCPIIITSSLDEREAEQSGGLQATVRYIGLVLGISLFGGLNQWAMDHRIQSNHELSTYYPSAFVQDLKQLSHVPYIDDRRLETLVQRYQLGEQQTSYLLKENARARVFGFDLTMILLITLAFLGSYVSSNIDKPPRKSNPPLTPFNTPQQ